MRLSATLTLIACLTGAALAQPSYVPNQVSPVYPYQSPDTSFSAQNATPNPYGPNIAPYYNQQEARRPNASWAGHVGEIVRQGNGGLWIVNTSGLMPRGSVVSIQRNGIVVNGGTVVESGHGNALIKPWASSDIKGGDNVFLQSVAPVATAPVYDKFQNNRPTMQDPTYLYWTDYMHRDHPGQITPVFPNYNYNGYYNNGFYYR